jgi:hypothetical protein
MSSQTRPQHPDADRKTALGQRFDPPASGRIAAVNAMLDHAWNGRWLSRPSIEPDALVAKARRSTGLDAATLDPGHRERLALLSDALHAEAALTPLGRTIAHGQLVAGLANRFRADALWRRFPAILDHPIRSPIVILGQMRSGSTRMQRLLACDPRLTFTRFFESWNPLPRMRHTTLLDDRRLRGWVALRCARLLNPQFDLVHPTGVAQADEEIGLHSISLFGSAFEAQWRVPRFAAHGEALDAEPIYRDFKRLLQTLAWLRRDRGDRPWVLKVPQFTQDLDALLAVFPDARLVCLDRDPAALVASSASLVHGQMRMQSDQVDPHWIGREWLRKVALRHRRTHAARRRADVPQVDVAFTAMNEDWRREMHRVYDMLGVPLTPAVEARMARFVTARRHDRLGGHRYDLADYGASAAQVREALSNDGAGIDRVA